MPEHVPIYLGYENFCKYFITGLKLKRLTLTVLIDLTLHM